MSTDGTTPEPEPTEEIWAYAGLRLSSSGKLVEEWFPESGEADEFLWYRKRRDFFVIGGLYEIKVDRGEGRVSRVGDPTWTSESVPDYKRRLWSAWHNAAKAQYERDRLHANEAKVDALDEALKPLEDIVRQTRTRAQKDALVATIMRRLLNS